jgi:uncharacterized membrane protein (UPF0127 family)
MRKLAVVMAALAMAACNRSTDPIRDFSSREVVLPSGKKIRAEVMTNPTDMARGMMFRATLPPDRGMLFIHGSPGKYTYWMYQVEIPLDIIWLDANRRVVEVSANTPPCKAASARDCPNYGGHENAMYILELGGGEAAKNGITTGSVINF